MSFWVYMLASGRNGTIYIGHTDDLVRRVSEHRAHVRPGFTARYEVTRLVWFEEHATRDSAFVRERRMKKWERDWKKRRIEWMNPGWRDLLDLFDGRTDDPEGEARRFLSSLGTAPALPVAAEKSLDPRLRGGERNVGGEGGERPSPEV